MSCHPQRHKGIPISDLSRPYSSSADIGLRDLARFVGCAGAGESGSGQAAGGAASSRRGDPAIQEHPVHARAGDGSGPFLTFRGDKLAYNDGLRAYSGNLIRIVQPLSVATTRSTSCSIGLLSKVDLWEQVDAMSREEKARVIEIFEVQPDGSLVQVQLPSPGAPAPPPMRNVTLTSSGKGPK
jgi:hypothetical protein